MVDLAAVVAVAGVGMAVVAAVESATAGSLFPAINLEGVAIERWQPLRRFRGASCHSKVEGDKTAGVG